MLNYQTVQSSCVRWLQLCTLLILTGGFTKTARAYDPDCTHQVLTRRTAELYAKYYGQKFSQADIEKLVQGSRHEDLGSIWFFRSSNHFYDYHHNKPWSDLPALLGGSIALSTCFLDAHLKGNIHTAKDWALNPSYQQLSWKGTDILPCAYDGDYSWPTILEMLDSSTLLSRVTYATGHILHLIQDLTVPAHTRNDTHFPTNSDKLEDFAKGKCNSSEIPSAEQLYKEGVKPIVLEDFKKNFDILAEYSYSHFFSNDTKFSKEYDLPKTTRRGTEIINGRKRTYLYTTDDSSISYKLPLEYRLVEVNTVLEVVIPGQKDLIYSISNECAEDYWQRTSRKAIAYGAGVLRKLVLEAENRGQCSITSRCLSCTPGTTRCAAGTLYTCNMSGTGETSTACTTGMCQDITTCKPPMMGGACGTGCASPLVCSTNGCVPECGGKNQFCCEPGKTCSIPGELSFCDSKASLTCSPCGNTYQTCCPTGTPCPKWTEGLGSVCDVMSNMCWPCGKRGTRCCETGTPCEAGTMCYFATGTNDYRCLEMPDP